MLGHYKAPLHRFFDPVARLLFRARVRPNHLTVLGLGLSIAYGAIKNHGGTIAVKSTPEQGTAVIVQLPLKATVSPAHGRPEPSRSRNS